MTHDLAPLARSQQLDSLETAWAQAVQSPDPAASPDYVAVVDTLCEQAQTGRALALATAMVDALKGAEALDQGIELALRVVRRGAHNEALVRNLVGMIEQRFQGEDWWTLITDRAGLDPAGVSAQALIEFDRLRRYTKGHVVYHQAGWGEGVVLDFFADRKEIAIRFASGRREEFPVDTVFERFKPLDADDLRAMKLLQIDELKRQVKDEPAVLIRTAARLYRGTITSQQVKTELVPTVVEERAWASFWKRAKTAATKDPWLKVEGSATRPTFVLRDRPIDLAEEAAQALVHENNLGDRIAVLRDYLIRGQDDEVKRQILDLAERTVEQAIAGSHDNHAHVLDGILFLEEHGRKASVPAAQELRQLLIGPDGALHPLAIDRLATQKSREHAVTLLPEALGEHWVDRCLAVLPDIPVSVLENVVQAIVDAGQGERLLDLWDRVAPYPRRHPMLTYLLGRVYADGVFDGRDDRPDDVTVGRVLLHLARVLTGDRKGNTFHNRLLSRCTSLMTGKRGFLHKPLAHIEREDLSNYLGITERGGEDFPQEIGDLVLRAVADKHPDLTAKAERPYWERPDVIFSTIAGLRRIKEEYRVLVEEKIPTNSKAIGAAASLGDLSENSEWESAMEEQRNLTTRASDMDAQIRIAKLIEDQEVPADIVAPGTRITYTEEIGGRKHTYKVLGPWDVIDDHTINYLAPIAQGLLGLKVGQSGEIPTPVGPVKVTIDAIERL
ncbi:MAG: GreA/GreB family elongation factor [Planctomycetota bacterium]